MKIHKFFTTVIYIYMFKMSKIYNRIVHEYKCLFLAFILFQIERESGKQNLGVKGKCPKVTYLIFLTGFHWRISLLSRASRLGTVFNAGLRDSGLSCLSLLSLARSENGYRPSPTSVVQKLTFFVFTSVEGKGTPLPFEAPANHLASFFFPLPMSGDPRSLKCKHLCDPHSLITVTFLLLDNFSSTGREYHSHLLVSVSHHVTIVSDW